MAEFLGAAAQLVDPWSWLAVLLNASLKGGLILVLALAAVHIRRSSPASVRHWIGAMAICSLLLLPAVSALLPSWDVPLISRPAAFDEKISSAGLTETQPKPSTRTASLNPITPLGSFPTPSGKNRQYPPADQNRGKSAPPSSAPSNGTAPDRYSLLRTVSAGRAWLVGNWPMAAMLAWLSGTSLLLARLMVALLYVAWLVQRCCLAPHPRWQRVAGQMAHQMGIRRNVQLLFSPRLQVALSVGLWKPLVVLPASAQTWSAARMRSILLHELAHVRRWDNMVNLASQVVCALYWFNPLVWWLTRRVMVDREQACDDAVLQMGTRASEYAGHLLEVATASLPGRRSLWRPVEVSHASALKDRLHAILDRKLSRAPLGHNALASSLLLILLLTPLAAFRPWADPAFSPNAFPVTRNDANLAKKRVEQQADSSEAGGGFRPKPARPPTAAPGEDIARQSLLRALETRTGSESSLRGMPRRSILAQAVSRRSLRPGGIGRKDLEQFFGQPVEPSGLPLAGPQMRPRQVAAVRSAPSGEGAGSGESGGNGANSGTDGPAAPGRILDRREVPAEDNSGPETPDAPAESDPDPEPQKILLQRSLGTLGGSVSQGLAINKSGQVAGYSTTRSGEMRPFFWDPSTGMVDLGSLGGHGGGYCGLECWQDSVGARALDINENGEVIGISTTAEGEVHAFLWNFKDGMIDLGSLGGDFSQASDINEAGQVTGYSSDSSGRIHAFFWSKEGGMIDLSQPNHLESWGAALNDSGQVVGSVDGHAFVWTAEAGMQRLTSDSIFSQAVDINNQGQITGQAAFVRNQLIAFVWDPDNGVRPLGTLGEEFEASHSLFINQAGQVVGRSLIVRDLSLGDIITRTFFWSHETGMVDVDSFGAAPALNNSGQIAGRRPTDPDSKSIRGFLWSSQEGILELGNVEEHFDLSWPSALNDEGAIAGVALPEDVGLLVSDSEYQAVVWQFVAQQESPGISTLEEAARKREETLRSRPSRLRSGSN